MSEQTHQSQEQKLASEIIQLKAIAFDKGQAFERALDQIKQYEEILVKIAKSVGVVEDDGRVSIEQLFVKLAEAGFSAEEQPEEQE